MKLVKGRHLLFKARTANWVAFKHQTGERADRPFRKSEARPPPRKIRCHLFWGQEWVSSKPVPIGVWISGTPGQDSWKTCRLRPHLQPPTGCLQRQNTSLLPDTRVTKMKRKGGIKSKSDDVSRTIMVRVAPGTAEPGKHH